MWMPMELTFLDAQCPQHHHQQRFRKRLNAVYCPTIADDPNHPVCCGTTKTKTKRRKEINFKIIAVRWMEANNPSFWNGERGSALSLTRDMLAGKLSLGNYGKYSRHKPASGKMNAVRYSCASSCPNHRIQYRNRSLPNHVGWCLNHRQLKNENTERPKIYY